MVGNLVSIAIAKLAPSKELNIILKDVPRKPDVQLALKKNKTNSEK